MKRAHPLLDRVSNATPLLGGTAPAGIDDTRSQAPRFIRTFDRAVSVSDLADLALTIPGIARAAARWDQATGAILVVATGSGETPPGLETVRAFLDTRRDVTVPLHIVGPQPHNLRVTVEIEADPGYLAEVVKATVRAALHGDGEALRGCSRSLLAVSDSRPTSARCTNASTRHQASSASASSPSRRWRAAASPTLCQRPSTSGCACAPPT